MNIAVIKAFFGWCTIINGALLIISSLVCSRAGNWIYRMHGWWFPISRESFNLTIYCFIGAMKLVVILFNLVPYIALVVATG